jgi:hypothetical protein
VATEGGFNPVPILVHLLAVACGLAAGWVVMDRISPAFPTDDPGIESSSAPGSVAGNDPDSLFLPANFTEALRQVDDQLAAGQGVVTLHLEPGSIDVKSSDVDGTFSLAEVPASAPAHIVDEIHSMRERVTLEDIGYMNLVAARGGPRWYVQLDINRTDVDPPWTYTAPLAGDPVAPGGPIPKPIDG